MILTMFTDTDSEFVSMTQMILMTYLWYFWISYLKATTEDGLIGLKHVWWD
jgi:hypothetical protein